MTANVNPTTGVPYGVISGHSCPILYAAILDRGTNERLEARDEEVRTTIRFLCKDMLDPGAGDLNNLSMNGMPCYGVPPEYLGEES